MNECMHEKAILKDTGPPTTVSLELLPRASQHYYYLVSVRKNRHL